MGVLVECKDAIYTMRRFFLNLPFPLCPLDFFLFTLSIFFIPFFLSLFITFSVLFFSCPVQKLCGFVPNLCVLLLLLLLSSPSSSPISSQSPSFPSLDYPHPHPHPRLQSVCYASISIRYLITGFNFFFIPFCSRSTVVRLSMMKYTPHIWHPLTLVASISLRPHTQSPPSLSPSHIRHRPIYISISHPSIHPVKIRVLFFTFWDLVSLLFDESPTLSLSHSLSHSLHRIHACARVNLFKVAIKIQRSLLHRIFCRSLMSYTAHNLGFNGRFPSRLIVSHGITAVSTSGCQVVSMLRSDGDLGIFSLVGCGFFVREEFFSFPSWLLLLAKRKYRC